MPLQVAGIVKDPHYIDRIITTTAIDQNMPGLLDDSQPSTGMIAAVGHVVSPDTARQIWPLPGAGPLRIGSDVAKRLLQKIAVARSRALAKSLPAPDQCCADITARER